MVRLVRINKFHIFLLSSCLFFLTANGENLFAETETYSVAKGDTLYGIARKFNVPLQVLIDFNGLKKNDSLIAGTRLKIPDLYTVQKGDTLFGIARKFDVTLEELLAASGRSADQPLKTGESIYIPGKSAPESDTAAAPDAKTPAAASEKKDTPAVAAAGRSADAKETAVKEPVVSAPPVKKGMTDWPLPGERSFQDGKLPRIIIHGKKGEPVVNIVPGQIIWVGMWGIFGLTVFVQSDSGYIYIYSGSDSVNVKVGDRIGKGKEIGTLGLIPGEKEPVLNFFVYKDGKPVHPANAPR